MESSLLEYLHSVGIVDGVSSASLSCEVCGCADNEVLVEEVEAQPECFARLPVVSCLNCGFVFQNPRFNKSFYDTYYDKYYRLMLFGNTQPEQDFLRDQVRRGEYLYRSLSGYLPEKGRLLDVGCSAGGLMVPFAKRGWEVLGTDPDSAYVEFGCHRLGLDIKAMAAEDMELPAEYFNLIIITGSLEHVFDVNRVLNICRKACVSDGLLLIEGRALDYGVQKGFFSHNHRRYLTASSIELLMLKHGWHPLLSTADPLCGPTRPGGVYVLGRAAAPMTDTDLMAEIDGGRRDDVAALHTKLRGMRGVR